VKEKSVKYLTKTLAVVSLFAPITAQPLGIGDIRLHSALNQKLNAEIHLHLAPNENPSDVTVRLASPEKFDKAGIPWNYVLSKIKFSPVVQPDGSILIKVTSREVLSEPFLDFLMEVVWPQGSQFREFTVLLDPPEGYHPPVVPSVTSVPYEVKPLEDFKQPVRQPRARKTKAASSKVASHINPQTPTSGEYGPTQQAETLWRIADQLGKERDVPTNTMMMALFRANPEAFIRGDINSMKVNAVLKIPETEAILQSGKAASQKKAESKQKPTAPKTEAVASTKALELVAPAEAKIPDIAQITEQTRPGAESGKPGKPVTGDEEGEPTSDKDLELQDRLDRLEQQLNMMQQLLALKDQQLAALQSKDTDAAQQAAESAKNLQATQPVAPEAEVTESKPTPEAKVTEPAPTPKPAPAPKPEQQKPTPPVPPAPIEEESDFLYYVTLGGAGGGILGLLGWLLWRKRRIETQENTESMFASASQIKLPDTDSNLSVPVLDMSSTGSYDVGTVGESSFISDFTPSDFEAFDTDQTEVDPMSEADVYLAYGRYQQAEDLMRQAIDEQPNKDEYKLKLFEIFYANENKERFAVYAQELADAGKNADRPFWSKVSDMAKEIIPDSPLFGGAASSSPNKPTTTQATEIDTEAGLESTSNLDTEDSFDFDESDSDNKLIDLEAPTLSDEEFMEELDTDDNSLDFDLGSFSEKEEPKKTEISEASADEIESIDFDLNSFGEEAPSEAEDTEKSTSETLESFDFNFDLDSEPSSETTASPESKRTSATEEPITDDLESFDFSDLGGTDTEEAPETKTEPSIAKDESSSDFDFNFDFEAPSSDSDEDEFDLGVADLTDMDEFETKIDLAKAYIDMGDADAAKTIAEEVLEKGNQEQKQAAQAILDELE